MLVKTSLRDIAGQVRQLLSCASVHVILGCPVPEFQHTLFDRQPLARLTVVAEDGAPIGDTLLRNEQVRALCDIAIYKGQLSALHGESRYGANSELTSIAAAPLETPSGVIGLLLLTDALPNAFSYGETLLLQRALPRVALSLEDEAPALLISCRSTMTIDPLRTMTTLQSSNALLFQVNQQLKALDPLRNTFLSMISHELRSPITAIKGYAILLQAYGISGIADMPDKQGMQQSSRQNDVGVLTPEKQREYLDIIMEQTNHLEVLIRDVLDLSRLQAGRLSLRSARVDIAQLCRRAIQLVQQRAETQSPGRYIFHCDIETELPPLWTDAHRVQQILTNLLENAIKYSPAGGLIELHAHSLNPLNAQTISISEPLSLDMLAITIRDYGIGIPFQQQSRLFKPFSRIEHAQTQDIPGVGLGLYITCKLVEALGGTITFQSSEGQGTTFTVMLPVNQAARS